MQIVSDRALPNGYPPIPILLSLSQPIVEGAFNRAPSRRLLKVFACLSIHQPAQLSRRSNQLSGIICAARRLGKDLG